MKKWSEMDWTERIGASIGATLGVLIPAALALLSFYACDYQIVKFLTQ